MNEIFNICTSKSKTLMYTQTCFFQKVWKLKEKKKKKRLGRSMYQQWWEAARMAWRSFCLDGIDLMLIINPRCFSLRSPSFPPQFPYVSAWQNRTLQTLNFHQNYQEKIYTANYLHWLSVCWMNAKEIKNSRLIRRRKDL